MLNKDGLREILNIQRRSDGLPNVTNIFFRALEGWAFKVHGNYTLAYGEFEERFLHLVGDRNHMWLKFKVCSLARARGLLQKVWSCLPRRYLAASEAGIAEDIKYDNVTHFTESFKKKSLPELPVPPGGYQKDFQSVREPDGTPLVPGCHISDLDIAGANSLTCSFERDTTSAKDTKGSLAILVTGLKNRFYPRSTFKHVVRPAVRAGYTVDYFGLIDWIKTTMVNYDPEEMDFGTFNRAKTLEWERSAPNLQFANASKEQVFNLLARYARFYGASNMFLTFVDPGIQEDFPPPLWCNRYLGFGTAMHPIFRRTRMGYKNLQILWNLVQDSLRLKGKTATAFTKFLWLRDDMYWMSDLNLDDFPEPRAVYAPRQGSPCRRAPAVQRLQPDDISDKAIIIGADAARKFFQLYDIANCKILGSERRLDSEKQFWSPLV